MKEYIERATVIDLITRRYELPELCTHEINSIPAADVVEVVRCRECVYNHPEFVGNETQWCELCRTTINPDDFCSRGQRKEAAHEVS